MIPINLRPNNDPCMAIRQVAFDAIATMLLDTVGYEGIASRGEGEDYSDVIIRLATQVG